jgi:cytochrome c oxidase subunit II
MQSVALQITAGLLLVLIVVFCWVLRNTKGEQPLEKVAPRAYRLRTWLFAAASVAGLVIALGTLAPWPHDARAAEVNRTIDVQARQWAWDVSSDKAGVGEVVEFVVTSVDVTHGFALYDPQKRIVAQIQAMPGFVNKVRHRFDSPGKYEVLCLEFCGLAHHGMVAEIHVTPAN